jgi:hypothetical protein
MANLLARLKDVGKLLFGVWLILMGLILSNVFGPSVVTTLNVVAGIILIAAGVFTLLGR